MINQLIKYIMMDLNNCKVAQACEYVGIKSPTFISVNKEDFLNKEFSLMTLREFEELRQAIRNHMAYEEEHRINMWDIAGDGIGYYMAPDCLIEAEIDLNTVIGELEELLENLE